MANDMLLRDAVRAVKLKIQAAAGDATPEELAYLGTAIDRIGGRATLLEVEELGDIKIAEFTANAAEVERATNASITATRNAAESSVIATKEAAEASISASRDAAEAFIDSTKVAAQSAISTTASSAVSTVEQAAESAISDTLDATQSATAEVIAITQAAVNSVTQQLVLGRKTFFFAQL